MPEYTKDIQYKYIQHSYIQGSITIACTVGQSATMVKTKGGPIPLFSDTFNTKYRAENFTDTDSISIPIPIPIPIHIAVW